jgi:hypothetical protein
MFTIESYCILISWILEFIQSTQFRGSKQTMKKSSFQIIYLEKKDNRIVGQALFHRFEISKCSLNFSVKHNPSLYFEGDECINYLIVKFTQQLLFSTFTVFFQSSTLALLFLFKILNMFNNLNIKYFDSNGFFNLKQVNRYQ